MERVQSLFMNVGSLIFILAAVAFGFQNLAQTATFNLLTYSLPNVSVGLALILTSLVMAIGCGIRLWGMLLQQKQTSQKALRSAEKLGVSAESSGEKVKALEQKIQTLETALEKALSRPTSPQKQEQG